MGTNPNTTYYKISGANAKKIIEQLEYFDDIEKKMNAIREKIEYNDKHYLKPEYYYHDAVYKDSSNGATQLDSKTFTTMTSDLVEIIQKIKDYIIGMNKANVGGSYSVGEIGALAVGSVDGFYDEIEEYDVDELYDDEDYEVEEYDEEDDEFKFDEDLEEEDMTENEVSDVDINETSTLDGIKSIDDNSIVDKVYDSASNLVAVSMIGANGKKWYQVIDGKIIDPETSMETFNIQKDLVIKIGDEEQTVPAGSYKVDNAVYNADGSTRNVRVKAGEYDLCLYLDSSGNIIKTETIKEQNGLFTITNSTYDAVDMYGNSLGKFDKGEYYIYDVMYDQNGNQIGYRLSADGEYEKWLYPNGNITDGVASLFDQVQANEEGTASVSMFEQNKGLFGLLGVLFVGLGASLVVRKKMVDKEKATLDEGDDYTDNYTVEDNISSGNYGVYDVKRNDAGLVTEARINPVDSSDEYWVEV